MKRQAELAPWDPQPLPRTDPERQSGELLVVPGVPRPDFGACSLETPHCKLVWEAERTFVRLVRSRVPYAWILDLDHDGQACARALHSAGRPRLLIDLRAVAARDDPSFEEGSRRFRRKLFGASERMVVLVRTAVGALQVKRHLREDGLAVEVFEREEEAIAQLVLRAPEPASCRAGH